MKHIGSSDGLPRYVLRAGMCLTGERFTAADIYTGSQLGWALQFGSIAPRPAFTAYWVRISDREAFRRASARDDAAAGGAGWNNAWLRRGPAQATAPSSSAWRIMNFCTLPVTVIGSSSTKRMRRGIL
ncbi:hypothetical protein GCM10011505_47550 [Tistrella bauzanensis]|uniref:GST C-terminal domain-containing protein n=1 Tax=Tistrella bauzanensis TaxID=657419 RepID=A0ABQ1J8W3_9PROT|nr:hypothetical protein [Tistrella bauzanensis]GGB61378.1 hypothetical protein GCM10011505_47550 [Tistrella bauzanensis]